MLYRLSHRIVLRWERNGIIPGKSEEAFIYGVQLLLSTSANLSCVAIISYFANEPLAWIPYLCGFVPLRITAGGFHAKTPLRCLLSFCSAYLVSITMIQRVQHSMVCISILANCSITLITIFFCSPIPPDNKPLMGCKKRRFRFYSLTIVAVLLLISVASILLHIAMNISLYLTSGGLTASVFLYVRKAQIIIRKRQNV